MAIDQSQWPSHVEPIGLDRLDRLGIDPAGRLYWDGEMVQTARLSLTTRQVAVAIAGVAAAWVVALVELARLLWLGA